MYYYEIEGTVCCSLHADLPGRQLVALPPDTDYCCFLFERELAAGRASFAVNAAAQLFQASEGIFWLDSHRLTSEQAAPPELERLIAKGQLRAVNLKHPRWQSLLRRADPPRKQRVNLLALGDVGSTLLLGLSLLGGEAISEIGICDLNPRAASYWQTEINQISWPWEPDRLPDVRVVSEAELFDCDMFVFCASKGVPPVGSAVGDVRMAQFEGNAAIVSHYARLARAAAFEGLFAVVSDPVDPLCKAALLAANRDEDGSFDGKGLRPEQIQGYGLGVMNARGVYFAKRDPRFARFLTEGRAYGPHGADLVLADSVSAYDDELSRELTRLAVNANLEVRELGYKPYVAPAIASGAIALYLTLSGQPHYSSTYLGGVFMGAKNRFTPCGLEVEHLPLPPELFARIEQAAAGLAAII